MVFLDTNAFYYVAKISEIESVDVESLQKYIEQNETAISSVSFYEFLVKFRNSIETIHKGCNYMAENHIKVAYNKYFPYSDELNCDFTSITEEKLNQILEVVIAKKIDVESRFASIVYTFMLFSASYFYFVPEGESASDLKKFIFGSCIKLWTKDNLDVFKEIFAEGYASDNCEKVVKNAVRNLLEFSLGITFPIFDAAADFDTIEQYHDLINDFDFMDSAEGQFKKMKKCDTGVVYLSKLAKKYNDAPKDQKIVKYINDLMDPIDKKIREKGLKEYLREIADKSCRNGSPFLKNDILDAIILCNIENEYEMISFDQGMIEHMKKYSEERETYKKSLNTINGFMKK